jgi:hypothetical protein
MQTATLCVGDCYACWGRFHAYLPVGCPPAAVSGLARIFREMLCVSGCR